ncbi:pyruvate formate lyase activating enzyme [Desulfocicer vacuolatum DSM 3385]|uniref:Pyruvate formate lyase activating enzyme n=1 Tax=Desulfocicer vacuolatum DSM 3385 TaxID=1121400 RepID=A0A1W2B013_9BACT|nr:anaerobic ribonucleoside-triphosphate reductase activating protein [Desulfocicer vacuolatum]SMC66130.1 pyruvate formate lyase activating enzyme [Desulfocicer vacuolatum DSM 3385]
MILGGLQKNSLIDFPGTVACVAFTSGCNFTCPYCHNPDLAKGIVSDVDDGITPSEFFAFLEKRKGLLDGVVITGGEPTLQKDLQGFCFEIKNMGYRIKLDTNGSHPRMVAGLLEQQLVDFVAMDIKSNLDGYPSLVKGSFQKQALMETVGLLMEKAPAYEFRTTCVRPFIDLEIMAGIGEMIKGASHYILQHCSRNVSVLNPVFFEKENRFFQDHEMLALQNAVKSYVVKCSIR